MLQIRHRVLHLLQSALPGLWPRSRSTELQLLRPCPRSLIDRNHKRARYFLYVCNPARISGRITESCSLSRPDGCESGFHISLGTLGRRTRGCYLEWLLVLGCPAIQEGRAECSETPGFEAKLGNLPVGRSLIGRRRGAQIFMEILLLCADRTANYYPLPEAATPAYPWNSPVSFNKIGISSALSASNVPFSLGDHPNSLNLFPRLRELDPTTQGVYFPNRSSYNSGGTVLGSGFSILPASCSALPISAAASPQETSVPFSQKKYGLSRTVFASVASIQCNSTM